MEVNGYIESIFTIQKLIDWSFISNLNKFKMSIFFSFIVNSDFSLCPGFGYEYDEVDFKISTGIKLTDCYKKIIQDICDFSTTWTGFEAKWVDECTWSQDAPVDLNSWNVLVQKSDEILAGTVNPGSSSYCSALPGIGTKTSTSAGDGDLGEQGLVDTFARMFYRNMGKYITGEELE